MKAELCSDPKGGRLAGAPGKWAQLMIFPILLAFGFLHEESISLNAKAFKPELGLGGDLSQLPLLAESLRDPGLRKLKPEDEADATRLIFEIKDLKADLRRAKGLRRTEILDQVYKAHIALTYYLQDALSDRLRNGVKASTDIRISQKTLSDTRKVAVRYALTYAKETKSKAGKARALYHINVVRYLQGIKRGSAVANLKKIEGKLNPTLKRRAQMLGAIHTIEYRAGKQAAERKLQGLIKSLPKDGGIVARLVLAKSRAGLNRRGHKVKTANVSYRAFLSEGTRRARNLSTLNKQKVFDYAQKVWRNTEGANIDWNKPPINLGYYSELNSAKAIIERGSLKDWRENRKARAMKKTGSLAQAFTGHPFRLAFDVRLLDMKKAYSEEKKSKSIYEKALLNAHRQYSDASALGDGNESKVAVMAKAISLRHKKFADKTLAEAIRRPSKQSKNVAIKVATNYLTTVSDDKEVEAVNAKIAQIYHLNKDYGRAVSLYRQLAETTVLGRAKIYYQAAIAAQTVLAKWPKKAPWPPAKLVPGHGESREELLALYGKLQEIQGPNWHIRSHRGLLMMRLGRGEDAFKIWTQGITDYPKGSDSQKAAGFMLVAYQKAKKWQGLENVARICLDKKISAKNFGKSLRSSEFLSLALIEGGKELLAQNNFELARQKLKEFVDKFTKHKRRDDGLFHLALAYRGEGKFTTAVETLITFAKQYPKSTYFKSAMLRGGDWSIPMAFEENALFFYSAFLARYERDKEAPRVREIAKELYLGRSIYNRASSILRDQAQFAQTPAEKEQALVELLEIENRFGSEARAHKVAKQLITMLEASDPAKAQALILFARSSAKKNDLRGLASTLGEFARLGSQNLDVLDVYGEAAFMYASAHDAKISEEYFNLELPSPAKTLEARYGSFVKSQRAYDKVCALGDNAFCAPAKSQLARISEKFLESMTDIQIQQDLAKEVVDKFENRKTSIFNHVTNISQASDQKSMEVVAEGSTDPDWTQAILWQNTQEAKDLRVSGETANTYVQWSLAEEQGENLDHRLDSN